MMIKVRTLTGRFIEFNVEPSDDVNKVKSMIQEKEGIEPAQQRLVYGGKQLQVNQSLESYGVIPDATLHLVLTLRGGC
ncbi:hypothetical protein F4778DRAFT_714617 [Xylariomycetidae sp. FL2044]|nr:hypothetical protein F4778DRAFT_714617 [Xylariomycetidae sp. FL2044]